MGAVCAPTSVSVTIGVGGQEPVHGVAVIDPSYDPNGGELLARNAALKTAKEELNRRFHAKHGFAPPPLGSAVDVAGMAMTVEKIDYSAHEVVLRQAPAA